MAHPTGASVHNTPARPPAAPLAGNRRRRVNGLALSAQGDLLVATRQVGGGSGSGSTSQGKAAHVWQCGPVEYDGSVWPVPPPIAPCAASRPSRRPPHTHTLAAQSAVLRFLSAQPWASERHADWPPAFRAAARTLLLAAQRQAAVALQRPDAAAGLWTLPLPLLQHILELAAGRRTDWLLPPAAAAPAAGAGGDS